MCIAFVSQEISQNVVVIHHVEPLSYHFKIKIILFVTTVQRHQPRIIE